MLSSVLYVIPTPIGNLQDITHRALFVLNNVDCIAAENISRVRILLNFFNIKVTSVLSFHKFNEFKKTSVLINKLKLGLSVGLVSDAGTPLINDPGYYLVQSCHDLGIRVVPLPGACAAITALCGSGLPTNRFCFEGFLPSKRGLRLNFLKNLSEESRTLIFYDVKYRVIDTLEDMITIFGKERCVVLARELTKIWESIYKASLEQLLLWARKDIIRVKGEIVLVVSGNNNIKNNQLSLKMLSVMELLASELPLKKAASLVGYIYGIKKKLVYDKYLSKKNNR